MRVIVSLSDNARRSDVDHFRALRSGDYVRAEGRFLNRERFELDSFLRMIGSRIAYELAWSIRVKR